jgi:opacity protein-like surface antigen
MFDTHTLRRAGRWTLPAFALVAACLTAASTARAADNKPELIPSVGWTKSTDANSGDAKLFGGLALRAPVLPFLNLEGQIAYREDDHVAGIAKERMWPVTASAWLKPGIPLYAGGGIGWYHTTFDFPESVPIHDTTVDHVGIHLGGGADVPLSNQVALDLNGRYIWMQQNNNDPEFPRSFDPDFWTVGLGLALKF